MNSTNNFFVFVQIYQATPPTDPRTGRTYALGNTTPSPPTDEKFSKELELLTAIYRPVQIITHKGTIPGANTKNMNIRPNTREKLKYSYRINQVILRFDPNDPKSVQRIELAIRRMGHLRDWIIFGDMIGNRNLHPSLQQSIYPLDLWIQIDKIRRGEQSRASNILRDYHLLEDIDVCTEFIGDKLEKLTGDHKADMEMIAMYDLTESVKSCHKKRLVLIYYSIYTNDESPAVVSTIRNIDLLLLEGDLEEKIHSAQQEGKTQRKTYPVPSPSTTVRRRRKKPSVFADVVAPVMLPVTDTQLPSIPEEAVTPPNTNKNANNSYKYTFDESGQVVLKPEYRNQNGSGRGRRRKTRRRLRKSRRHQ